MIAVAPCHIVAFLDEAHTRVVAIHPLANLLVVALEAKRLLVDVPVYAVLRETYVENHTTVGVVATEHTCEAFTEGHYSTVEDTVACRKQVTRYDRVLRTAPQRSALTLGTVLPRHIRQRVARND